MKSLINKLEAIGYVAKDTFECNDETKFRMLVTWLEDQKIRLYKEDERAPLRSYSSTAWEGAFEKYLNDLECPSIVRSSRGSLTNWLLNLAVRYDYGDNVDKYRPMTKENISSGKLSGKAAAAAAIDALNNLDMTSPDFINGVLGTAKMANIMEHENSLLVLKALAIFCETRLSETAVNDFTNNREPAISIALKDVELGLEIGDQVLRDAAKVLRLLHINELRKLQTKINEAIVAAQTVTANPKTDQSLGQVGR